MKLFNYVNNDKMAKKLSIRHASITYRRINKLVELWYDFFLTIENIVIDKVYTSISTKDSTEQDAELLMGIGPRARILSEENLSNEKISMIKDEIIQLCEQRQNGKEITYKACLNYVSANK